MRQYYIAGNWKMHKTPSETARFIHELIHALGKSSHRLMIAPSFVCLPNAVQAAKGSQLQIAAQNCSVAESGAHTGEVSVEMLADIGVSTVILGHSERRHVYGESNEMIQQKVDLAITHGMDVVLCVGETLDEREAGQAEMVVDQQIRSGLATVGAAEMSKITIAYEPVWAIGTGKTATPADANQIHKSIRENISNIYSQDIAEKLCIQYGGSVKPENVKALMAEEHIDGALVGGASLQLDSFTAIAGFDKEL